MEPLESLKLPAIMVFAVLAIMTITTGLWLKERTALTREIKRLHEQIVHPVGLR